MNNGGFVFIHGMVSVLAVIFRGVAAVDSVWGVTLAACGVSPVAQVFILAGICVLLAGIVLRGLGGVISVTVLIFLCLMILELEVPQLDSSAWVMVQLRAAF